VPTHLKQIRLQQKLSSSQLAHRLGVSQSTYIRSEQSEAAGSISLKTLSRVAAALGCRLEYQLVSLNDGKTKKVKPNNAYLGVKRSSRQQGRRSSLQKQMKTHELEISKHMSESEKLRRACELSDLSRALK
jgi:transcriptional regulator with XRE-family HTH domain